MKKTVKTRSAKLAKMREVLNRDGYPRIEMFLLVAFTGLAGFLTSYGLLHFGFNTVWLRYLISMGAAYAVFIALLGIWLAFKRSNTTSDLDLMDGADIIDGVTYIPSSSSSSHPPTFHGHGGTFDGGGSSADYISESSSDFGGVGETFGAVAEAEEAAIPLIVIGGLIFVALSVFIFTFSLVSSAPILFSELLVDGMLSASLYRRLKGLDKHHWLESAIKRTIWPFVFVTITFVVLGLLIGHYMPESHSLGDVFNHMKH